MNPELWTWLVNQGPVVVILVVGGLALWRENRNQQTYLKELLDDCWSRLMDELRARDKDK